MPPISVGWVPQPPGLGYDPAWYVPRSAQENIALGVLAGPCAPVVLIAPPYSGKSTTLRRLAHQIDRKSRADGETCTSLHVDLGSLSNRARDEPAECFRELAHLFVDAYVRSLGTTAPVPGDVADWVSVAWKRPVAPERRLLSLFEQRFLSGDVSKVVVALDRFDHVISHRSGNPLARMLRQWVQGPPDARWARLRLLLAVSSAHLYFAAVDAVSELFNVTLRVRLDGFRAPELRALAGIYRRSWSDDEIDKLIELVDGQPYLTRHIFFLEATGTPKRQLLELERLKREHCAPVLSQIWFTIKEREHLRKPLSALLANPGLKLSTDDYALLHQAGLVRREDDRDVVSNALLRSYFQEQLQL